MTTDTPPDVAQAEAEATTAEQAAEALAERVREGDEQVTAEQLATAQQAGVFARLRAEAARRKADRAAEQAAEQHRTGLIEQALALVDEKGARAPIAAAYEQAQAAVATLAAAIEQHDQVVTEAGRLLRAADCGPSVEYGQVNHGDYVTNEPCWVPGTRTAPRVDTAPHAVGFTYGEGTRAPIGTGPVLAVLFAEAAAGDAGRMPVGESALDRAPLTEHANRHRNQVHAFMAAAKGGEAK
ncbi:hypothetical protein NGM36_26220 [Streptomyces mutabilis]|uniref:hypothetical protein n=1 Tax=Streptomyces mutabilis TaxID=67332 RepID=UPI0022BA6370|nr:hypothetical protein [Streptomyces mutabilis]MCZ9353220.1 hypothetical protein [Streptomyces mutabilis]